nr:hypothetical protein [Saprospiraceae bacterium]
MKFDLCKLWILVFISPMLFIQCGNRGELSEGVLEYNLSMSFSDGEHLDGSDELMASLSEYISSGKIKWIFSENRELLLQHFRIMDRPFSMMDIIHLEEQYHNRYISFMDQNFKVEEDYSFIDRYLNEVSNDLDIVEDKNHTKEFFGLEGHWVEAYFANYEEEIRISGYICSQIPMKLTFIQGYEYNPFDGAILALQITTGGVAIKYQLINYEPAIDVRVFDITEENYELLDDNLMNLFDGVPGF